MRENRKKEKISLFQAACVLIMLSGTIYILSRAIYLSFADYSLLEKTLATFFLLSETFFMVHGLAYFYQVYRMKETGDSIVKPDIPKLHPSSETHPNVAILIPARHEPKEVLETTMDSCFNIQYSHKIIFLLDDSSEQSYKDEARELAHQYEAFLFTRENRHGAKAGVINDCVSQLGPEFKYIVIFDADQNPMPSFLSDLIPIMESNPKLALVQTPQFYSNVMDNKIAFAAETQQAVFYEYICEGKELGNSMICCGTNVIMRIEALRDVGGLDEDSVTEDVATSLSMHMKGWETQYFNHICTFGMGPESLSSYFVQQNRWASGNVGMLHKIFKSIMKSSKKLTLQQWIDYIITGSYYFIGWAYLFLVFCPIVYIFFNVPSFFMNPVIYMASFLPYFILSLAVFYMAMGNKRRYSCIQMMTGQALLFLTQPITMKASMAGILGIKSTFKVTDKGGSTTTAYRYLWPQLTCWVIMIMALTWGVNRMFYEFNPALVINLVWTFYHFVLMSSIFYFNEE